MIVRAARVRNLGLSLLAIALLGVSAATVVVASHRAQRLAGQQMDFVAGVSHELRTPLTAIRSAGQNLADGVVVEPGQVRRYGSLIENEGRRLSELVARVLAFAGIQSGQRSYQLHPTSLPAVIDETLAERHLVLEEKGVTVEKEVAANLPLVEADAAALKQAIRNLLDNAIAYGSPAGWIGLRARLVGRAGGREVAITIADRGPGIRKGDLPHIFEAFRRGSDEATARVPGSGLGLSVVRHVAAGHGGRVEVESTPGKGSAFTIYLPASTAGGAAAELG
jgi:signal transduction histidine kinase